MEREELARHVNDQNRVLVDLPLRVQKAQAAAFQLEVERDAAREVLNAVKTAIAMRERVGDSITLDGITAILRENV